MKDQLLRFTNSKIIVETKTHHIGYAVKKGILKMVGEDFIEMDCGNSDVIIPINQIRTITVRK